MSENPIPVALSPAEWTLIQAIRALPDSALRARAHAVFGKLLFYVENPRCQGMGAEGFPCGVPASTCDDCQDVWDLLEKLANQAADVQQA